MYRIFNHTALHLVQFPGFLLHWSLDWNPPPLSDTFRRRACGGEDGSVASSTSSGGAGCPRLPNESFRPLFVALYLTTYAVWLCALSIVARESPVGPTALSDVRLR